jgi:chromosome segregation ATPase
MRKMAKKKRDDIERTFSVIDNAFQKLNRYYRNLESIEEKLKHEYDIVSDKVILFESKFSPLKELKESIDVDSEDLTNEIEEAQNEKKELNKRIKELNSTITSARNREKKLSTKKIKIDEYYDQLEKILEKNKKDLERIPNLIDEVKERKKKLKSGF